MKEISCLQLIFVLIWIKQTVIWFDLQRYFCRKFAATMPVLHQSMSILQSSRLVSQVHLMTGQNVKKKYLMCQIPIKMLKQEATPNSSLHNLKIYLSKGCRKTSQRSITCMYLANTAVLNIRIFCRRYHFRLWVFASTGEYFYCWHWRVLRSVL